jgi:putative ABC transport system permease protein
MTWVEIARESAAALAAYRLRASLSAAGIVFGVATVVAALAVADGARRRAYDEIGALGVRNVFIRSTPSVAGRPRDARFTPEDLAAVRSVLPAAAVSASRRLREDIERPPDRLRGEIVGVTEPWRAIEGLTIAEGRWLTSHDVARRRRVAVLSPEAAGALFGTAAPLGERVRVAGEWFTVVGVHEPLRRAGDRAAAFVPIGAADLALGPLDGPLHAQEIAVQAVSSSAVEAAARRAAEILRVRGHGERDVEVVVPYALLRAKLATQRTFDWVLLAVGGLALLISGIGIMNIMLASVAERTMEIGVRRAAGATRRDVLAQFATEASMLCLAGGTAGVVLGVGLANGIAAGAGWPVVISARTVAAALLLAAFVGLLFGIYPARRAAHLDPIDALRA